MRQAPALFRRLAGRRSARAKKRAKSRRVLREGLGPRGELLQGTGAAIGIAEGDE